MPEKKIRILIAKPGLDGHDDHLYIPKGKIEQTVDFRDTVNRKLIQIYIE